MEEYLFEVIYNLNRFVLVAKQMKLDKTMKYLVIE